MLYQPPPAALLPARIEALCEFANAPADSGPSYLPPVLRAITLHFMLGYEHPFVDGNGRTARALFYWSMLRHGYWLTEFLSISRVLRRSPASLRPRLPAHRDRRQRPHLLLRAPVGVLHEAFDGLTVYLERKIHEVRAVREQLGPIDADLNHRQLALLRHAMTHRSGAVHGRVAPLGTSGRHRDRPRRSGRPRQLGLLAKRKIGKRYVFAADADFAQRVDALRLAGR